MNTKRFKQTLKQADVGFDPKIVNSALYFGMHMVESHVHFIGQQNYHQIHLLQLLILSVPADGPRIWFAIHARDVSTMSLLFCSSADLNHDPTRQAQPVM
jgi:hypothetical protein